MRLNQKQVNAVAAYLTRIPYPACALCANQDWKVSETVFSLPEYAPSNIMSLVDLMHAGPEEALSQPAIAVLSGRQPTPEVFPVIPIVCARCGFVYFISAVAAGVVPHTQSKL